MANDKDKNLNPGTNGEGENVQEHKEFFVKRFFKWVGRGAHKIVEAVQDHPVIATAVTAATSAAATFGVVKAVEHFGVSNDELPMIESGGEETVETTFSEEETDETIDE